MSRTCKEQNLSAKAIDRSYHTALQALSSLALLTDLVQLSDVSANEETAASLSTAKITENVSATASKTTEEVSVSTAQDKGGLGVSNFEKSKEAPNLEKSKAVSSFEESMEVASFEENAERASFEESKPSCGTVQREFNDTARAEVLKALDMKYGTTYGAEYGKYYSQKEAEYDSKFPDFSPLLVHCQKLFENSQLEEITKLIETIPEEIRSPKLCCELARAYNCIGLQIHLEPFFDRALNALLPHEKYGEYSYLWNYSVGLALLFLEKEYLGLGYLNEALRLCPNSKDAQHLAYVCKQNLALPTFKHPFAQRTQEFWHSFQLREPQWWRNLGFGEFEKAARGIRNLLNKFLPEQEFKMVIPEIGSVRLIMLLNSSSAMLFPLVYLIEHMPESLKKHWQISIGQEQQPESFVHIKSETKSQANVPSQSNGQKQSSEYKVSNNQAQATDVFPVIDSVQASEYGQTTRQASSQQKSKFRSQPVHIKGITLEDAANSLDDGIWQKDPASLLAEFEHIPPQDILIKICDVTEVGTKKSELADIQHPYTKLKSSLEDQAAVEGVWDNQAKEISSKAKANNAETSKTKEHNAEAISLVNLEPIEALIEHESSEQAWTEEELEQIKDLSACVQDIDYDDLQNTLDPNRLDLQIIMGMTRMVLLVYCPLVTYYQSDIKQLPREEQANLKVLLLGNINHQIGECTAIRSFCKIQFINDFSYFKKHVGLESNLNKLPDILHRMGLEVNLSARQWLFNTPQVKYVQSKGPEVSDFWRTDIFQGQTELPRLSGLFFKSWELLVNKYYDAGIAVMYLACKHDFGKLLDAERTSNLQQLIDWFKQRNDCRVIGSAYGLDYDYVDIMILCSQRAVIEPCTEWLKSKRLFSKVLLGTFRKLSPAPIFNLENTETEDNTQDAKVEQGTSAKVEDDTVVIQ